MSLTSTDVFFHVAASGDGRMFVSSRLFPLHIPDIPCSLSPVANFAAYSFAPPILVTPLGSLSVIIGFVVDRSVLVAAHC
jgi:hypothetical protein